MKHSFTKLFSDLFTSKATTAAQPLTPASASSEDAVQVVQQQLPAGIAHELATTIKEIVRASAALDQSLKQNAGLLPLPKIRDRLLTASKHAQAVSDAITTIIKSADPGEAIMLKGLLNQCIDVVLDAEPADEINILLAVDETLAITSPKSQLTNAVTALLGGIIAHLKAAKTKDPEITIEVSGKAAGTVTINLTDNGPSWDEAQRAALFTPFAVSLPASQRGGLDFYLAKVEAEKCGGQIRLVAKDRGNTWEMHNLGHTTATI